MEHVPFDLLEHLFERYIADEAYLLPCSMVDKRWYRAVTRRALSSSLQSRPTLQKRIIGRVARRGECALLSWYWFVLRFPPRIGWLQQAALGKRLRRLTQATVLFAYRFCGV